uniref:Rhino n=1 Tax=Drosophila simulans TaxID=7240 RepID=Q49BI1_DROSI|nr:rhino [Drosophila simulans]
MSRKNQRPNLGLVDAPPNDHVQEFVVEKIQGKRFVNGRPQVLVKWHGFPDESNTWEPMENVGNCMQLVSDFESELFRRMRNASAKPVGKSKPSPSSSGPSNTENGPSSSKKTQHSKSVQAKNTAKMSKMNQKKEKDIKKTAGKIKDIQNDPKTQMPSTSQVSTGLTEAFNGNPSATTNVIKSPRIHSVFNDPNLSESSEDEAVGATSLNYQRAGHSKQKSSTPPKSRGLIEFPQGEDEDSLLSSKNVSPMMILKESQPLQNSFTDDSDLGESSSSKSFLTVSSTSSEGSIKITKSEPKTSSLDRIKLSTRSSDGGHEAPKWAADKQKSTFGISSSMGSNDYLRSMGLDLSDSDSIDSKVESVHGCSTKQQSNWNFPEPLTTPPAGTKTEMAMHRDVQKESITSHAPKLQEVKKKLKTSQRGKRLETYPDWRMPETTEPFGLDRGLELDKVLHCYQMKELFLFVTWKGCSSIDAVPMKYIREAYPLQVIEFFQSLRTTVLK